MTDSWVNPSSYRQGKTLKKDKKNSANTPPVAVIGMGCVFPGSSDLKEYWRLIFRGIDAITEVPKTHWSPDDYFDPDPKKPDHIYCKRGGFLSPVAFDPTEFGIPPNSLEATDTSQLLGLYAAKAALDDAGYSHGKGFNHGKTSVILGVTGTQELVVPLSSRLGHPKWRRALEDSGIEEEKAAEIMQRISNAYVPWQQNSFPGLLGNVVAGRICNRLDLGGTNCVVDAACASSMSAAHMSLLELYSGRSDMVITGGVDTLNDIFMHMCFSKTMILSPTGDAKPFSSEADGVVLGEGIGMAVLKRLEDAVRDKDNIYAVIKSLGTSSDGKSQSIYAPRAEGQAQALRRAYEIADIDPSTVELVEAHGTGTRVGDQVEFKALKDVFQSSAAGSDNWCAIGSVKSMIGHTKAASGSAGLIKAVLALHHKIIPPTLKVEQPDPGLEIADSPFYLNTQTRPWLSNKAHPRRCAVSSFGFGGSNFHTVLEEYQRRKTQVSWDGSVEIFAFSADSNKNIAKSLRHLQKKLTGNPGPDAIAVLAAKTRSDFKTSHSHRMVLVLEAPQKPADLLENALLQMENNHGRMTWNTKQAYYGSETAPGKLAFVFPGQGSQYIGMGRDLICAFPEALEALEHAERTLDLPDNLNDLIFPKSSFTPREQQAHETKLRSTDITQPALGAVCLALHNVLQRFNVKAQAACGHSYGELPALFAGGVIDKDTLLQLSFLRGRYMAAADKNGAMLAVKAPIDKLEALIRESNLDVILANRNSPVQGVLSGPADAITAAEKKCRENKFRAIRLPVSTAFHSRLVQDAQEPFMKALEKFDLQRPGIPIFSNTSALPYPDKPDAAGKLLGRQIIRPVNFIGVITNMYDKGVRTFVEVGPKTVLTGLVKTILKGREFTAIALDASSGKQFGIGDLARTLGHLAALGYPVKLEQWEKNTGKSPRKQMMSLPVCGANLKNSTGGIPESPMTKPDDSGVHFANHKNTVPDKNQIIEPEDPCRTAVLRNMEPALTTCRSAGCSSRVSAQTVSSNTPPHMDSNAMKTDNPLEPQFIHETLRVVREGLKSMETLQNQTAETHKIFLETQTQAGRTLQDMMKSMRSLAEAAMGKSAPGRSQIPAEPSSIPFESRPVSSDPSNRCNDPYPLRTPEIKETARQSGTKAPVPQVEEKSEKPGRMETDPSGAITGTLLEIVGELTGYPMEMLGMDMDIEADLGIDSIKRVEILSALEEKLPELPAVSPEIMGTLKTLGQIAKHITPDSQAPAALDSPATTAGPADGNQDIKSTLLEIVGELTGYPMEMLGMDMDIEADLGIDSIKRVEILSALEEKMPALPSVSPETMGTLKTLGQIAKYVSEDDQKNSKELKNISCPLKTNSCIINNKESHQPIQTRHKEPRTDDILRHTLAVRETPFEAGSRIAIAKDRNILIIDKSSDLAGALMAEFSLAGQNALIVAPDATDTKLFSNAGGVVILAPDTCTDESFLKQTFELTRQCAPALLESAGEGGAFFATVSRLDGAFGFNGHKIADPMQGGLAGLAKTAALEWQNVFCKALDLEPDWHDHNKIAAAIVQEVLNRAPAPTVEVGLGQDSRLTLELIRTPLCVPEVTLNSKDVFLVSGGARGVTAAAALALARHGQPTLILIGRSVVEKSEPEWLAPLSDEKSIKKAIIKNKFTGKTATPAEVDKLFNKYMSHREIETNLNAIRTAGANVSYFAADVRDEKSIQNVIDQVHKKHGAVTGIVHGAGILEDRLIIDKTTGQFNRVFDTKVKGLAILLEATCNDPLKHLVLFSSVTARMGNPGQADYAMANEVLNKIARTEATMRPDCRVISINWGPWDGGMVSSTLKRAFEKRGVSLIPIKEGTRSMLREMNAPTESPVEIVIGSGLIPDKSRKSKNQKQMSLSFKLDVDIKQYPILDSHILGGKPVVPFALMAEWSGHGALHENPGLFLSGIDDMRLLKGIQLGREKKAIRLLAGKARKNGQNWEVDVELREDGVNGDREVVHFRARAVLTDKPSRPALFHKPELLSRNGYSRSIKEIYDKILFHGRGLHGIEKVTRCTAGDMVARIFSAPSPSNWMSRPLRSTWIGDPLVLDSAFQMASLWCFEEKGMVSLPSYGASYRQYCDIFPKQGIQALLEIKNVSEHKMIGDFTFLDSQNRVIARLNGYEAVMDPSLFRAFQPQHAGPQALQVSPMQ
ncbi:MAG: SDR family oxidoreductase [Deltaproteobacteria bacterium]|nr:SDR family oxidoreductase [Deltaproteobacteria bacterium]